MQSVAMLAPIDHCVCIGVCRQSCRPLLALHALIGYTGGVATEWEKIPLGWQEGFNWH